MNATFLAILLAGCSTPPPTYRDHWRGAFLVESEIADAASRATTEWNRAASGRIEWQVVSTEDDITPFADWTLSSVPTPPADADDDWRGRAAGNAAIVLSGLAPEKLYRVLLHELGHIAGLDDGVSAIMREKASMVPDTIDSATIAALDEVP